MIAENEHTMRSAVRVFGVCPRAVLRAADGPFRLDARLRSWIDVAQRPPAKNHQRDDEYDGELRQRDHAHRRILTPNPARDDEDATGMIVVDAAPRRRDQEVERSVLVDVAHRHRIEPERIARRLARERLHQPAVLA